MPRKKFADSALPQRLGNNGGVFFWTGLEPQFGMTACAYKALRPQFEKSGGEHLPVGQLFAHVAVVNAAWKNKGYGLTGKVFNYEVFHGDSSAVLGFAPILQILAHGPVVVC